MTSALVEEAAANVADWLLTVLAREGHLNRETVHGALAGLVRLAYNEGRDLGQLIGPDLTEVTL